MTLDPNRPFLLLRARTHEEQRVRFTAWFRQVHLRDVGRIPGIAGVRTGTTRGGTRLGFYEFESTATVQAALSSPEAAYARGTWEQWAPQLEELSIELFAPLAALGVYQSRS